jgi:hypothetical protein
MGFVEVRKISWFLLPASVDQQGLRAEVVYVLSHEKLRGFELLVCKFIRFEAGNMLGSPLEVMFKNKDSEDGNGMRRLGKASCDSAATLE